MMKIPAVLLPAAAALLMLSACDDSTTGASSPTTTEGAKALLVGGKWIPAARTINPGFDMMDDGHVITNVFAVEDACEHDDIMQFTADGKWSTDEGAQKCDTDDPQVSGGNWRLSANVDSIYMSDDGEPGEIGAKLVALNASTLSISATSDNWPDDKARVETFTWKAK
jgi:hypothetical protein